MVDQRLEEQARQLSVLIERWSRLHEIYKKVTKAKAGTPEEDQELLQIRIFLSQNYRPLAAAIGLAVDKDDKVLDFLSHIRDVESVVELSDIDRRRYEAIWHESEVQLHTIMGEIEARRRTLAAISPADYWLRAVWSQPAVRWLVGIGAALLILWITGLLSAIKDAIRNLNKG